MKVLFLTLVKINSFDDRGIYHDLLRKFDEMGHEVYVVCPVERREKRNTFIIKEDRGNILNVRTLNLQKTNLIEKGIGTIAIEYQFLFSIKKYFSKIKFDLIIYSTPPITFSKVINFIKKRDNAYSYLLLKDIFPQNAIDMNMFKEKGLLHKFFLREEQKLYSISDTIGCMSEANKKYILHHNPDLEEDKVEVNPNSIEPVVFLKNDLEKKTIKLKYRLPIDKKIFIYGGNLGKPQGIDFLLEIIDFNNNNKVFFLIVGSGTEFDRIEKWFQDKKPLNAMLFPGLPKDEYDSLLNVCDVGMIFLHKNFTIPNFPSRLLSYLEMKIPIIAATDPNTDIGLVIEQNNCGFSVMSGDINSMNSVVNLLAEDESLYNQMKENAWTLLQKEYIVDKSYNLINRKVNV